MKPYNNVCKSLSVNPGAKERLVQITGPSEEKIKWVYLIFPSQWPYRRRLSFPSYAKSLIEDTIRRNASPVRLDSQDDSTGMSSGNGAIIGNMIQQPVGQPGQTPHDMYMPDMSIYPSKFRSNFGRGGGIGSGPQHSYSTDDASLGEYKYTVNVGQRSIKITGDNFELIRTAKLVLDDYFSSAEFLQSVGDYTEDYNHPYHHGGLATQDAYVGNCQNVGVVLRDDSGIALDKKSPGKVIADEIDGNNDEKKRPVVKKSVRMTEDHEKNEVYEDDDVFIVDENGKEIPIPSNNVAKGENGAGSLARSKKSSNLRYSNSPSKPGSESEYPYRSFDLP